MTKNKMLLCSTPLMGLVLLIASCVWLFSGETTVTTKVIDENGDPIPGSTVSIGWSKPIPKGSGWGSMPAGGTQAITDQTGIVHLQVGGVGAMRVTHPKYYFNGITTEEIFALMPNPVLALNSPKVTVTLLKKLKPVPMYVRRVVADGTGKIPRLGEACGFDLMRCDWVEPYGKGEVSDLIVTANFAYRGERDYDYNCNITFAGSHDGIRLEPVSILNRMSELRLPREAPLEGYRSDWALQGFLGKGRLVFAAPGVMSDPGGARNYENDNFIFRIRSSRENGKNAGGFYGKIHGELAIKILPWYPKPDQEKYLGLDFFYYLNPDGTNSLEWNGQNLFGELPPNERFTPEP